MDLRTVKQGATNAFRWLAAREPAMLLVLLILAVGLWGFIEIAGEVVEGDTSAFDKWAVESMRKPDDLSEPIGPEWLQEMGRDATALGGIGWLVAFTAIVCGYVWLDRKPKTAVFIAGATASGFLLSLGLKRVFDRPRPDIVPHLSHVATASFPSGHSMLSAVVYLTIGSILAAVTPRKLLKAYILAVAVLLSICVGVSRVYLGVHYPTDVLAGWIAGLVWAVICWLVARWLQHRRVAHNEAPNA